MACLWTVSSIDPFIKLSIFFIFKALTKYTRLYHYSTDFCWWYMWKKNHIWTCTWKHRFCLTDMCIVMDKIHEIHWWILPVTYKWMKWTGVWIWMLAMPLGKMNVSKQAGVAEFVCIHWTVVMIDYTFARSSKSKLSSKPPNSICHSLLFRLDQVVFMAS